MNSVGNIRSKIRIGTSGYHYPDWKTVFYPPELRASDYLEFYSRHFQAIEINGTYYKIPSRTQMKSLNERTPNDMAISVKAYNHFTHGSWEDKEIDAFRSALDPIAESGKLRALLFQFPFTFQPTPESWDRITRINLAFTDFRRVIEFRHGSWIDPGVFTRLHAMDLSFCAVDGPSLPKLPGIVSNLTNRLGYIRFHGRNARRWWDHEKAWERYDYLYSERELAVWKVRIERMATDADTVLVFFNNHYQGQAVQNARMLDAFWKD